MNLQKKYNKIKVHLLKKYKKIKEETIPTKEKTIPAKDNYIRWILYVHGNNEFIQKIINNTELNQEFSNIRIYGGINSGLVEILLGESCTLQDREGEEDFLYNLFDDYCKQNLDKTKQKVMIYTGPSEQRLSIMQKIEANKAIIKKCMDQNEKLLKRIK